MEEEQKQLDSELKNEENKEAADDADERSIFVKNVDYSAEPQELKEHFLECGEVKRITIPVDKVANQPKGYAYVEFTTKEAAVKAKRLNESLFKGRQITVIPKRKNLPGKGRASKGRNPMVQLMSMMQMAMRGGRGRGRGGRGGFKPY